MIKLFEILIPFRSNDGVEFGYFHNNKWDTHVIEIAGGLTKCPPVEGSWVNDGSLYKDRMIPARIACTQEQIEDIVKFTAKHYDQLSVMYYVLSTEVIFYENKTGNK